MVEGCVKTYYPKDKGSFSAGSDARVALDAGRQVTIDNRGWIIEVWDPVTNNIYDNLGNEIGTKNEPPKASEPTEVRKTGYYSFTHAQKPPRGTLAYERWKGELQYIAKTLAHWYGSQVISTVNMDGEFIEAWNPGTGKIYDRNGKEIGYRSTAFPDTIAKVNVRTPGIVTYKPEDKNLFSEDSDAWLALNAGRDVTLNHGGHIIDIWDPTTRNKYDVLGNIIGTRKDPFPSHNNIAETKKRVDQLTRQVADLWQQYYRAKGVVRASIYAMTIVKLRERGTLFWLYGRLVNRWRRMDEKYLRRRIERK